MGSKDPIKKRKLTHACDRCRLRKKKCDAVSGQSMRCSNCIAFDAECTYIIPTKKRGRKLNQESASVASASDTSRRKFHSSYVEDLERRADELENTLKELYPGIILPEGTTLQERPRRLPISVLGVLSQSAGYTSESEGTEPDTDLTHLDLMVKMKKMTLNPQSFSQRCFGPSSSFALFLSAISIERKPKGGLNTMQLQDYSNVHPWERATADAEKSHYVFPDNDLITSLIAIYFETIHPIFPVLHRPTFTKDVANGLHLRDESFGATLLLVLSVASRYSDDPRVFTDPSSRLSAGWEFIHQAPLFKKAVLSPPSLYELQSPVLGAIYSLGTSVPRFSWTMVGVGLRAATEIGLHRRKPEGHNMTVDDELKKRSFWALITLDRLLSLHLGRPVMIQEEDFDLELPIECDDEYWNIRLDGEVHFCQPPDKPSIISYFNSQIRLSGIMSVVVRMLYPIKKGRQMLGLTGEGWEERLVTDIDTSTNAWMNSIPVHLRWDPNRDNTLFLYQSAVLYTTYYMLQIHIYRPFLCTDSPLSETSLAISTTVASSCTRILQVHLTRIGIIGPHILMGAFMSGTVLAMNIWSRKRASHPPNADDLAGFAECLATFIRASDTWNIAGRSLKMFKAMTSIETVNLFDHTSVCGTHPRQSATPISPIRSSFSTVSDADFGQFASTDGPHLNKYLSTRLGTRLSESNQADEGSSSPFRSSFLDTSELELSSRLDMWTYAPPGFSFAEWDAYVTSLDLENGPL
ncbi:fungal-specific transcription factor domain-containing protein [Armillaria novae-zelandiae]|uniref:Fungal-specific transcription factor domain-containing protein n=1 Tax=Armillaria novae-zelandiae TaxID=153914 RepID=A0AA39UH28_9AGAR|nr:fungal-specific transcription factor domain-containing protein [Armillaria novae-zelandiae]